MVRKFGFAAILVSVSLAASAAMAEKFTFVALGDMPYGPPEKVFKPFETLIQTINARKPAFTLHIGDTKSGSTKCDNEMLDAQLGFLNSFAPAAIYTPGDNEWTDCHRSKAGGFDPIERLNHIRQTYFTDPSTSFGTKPMKLEFQSANYPENTRFSKSDVAFVQAHVVGSNNNFEVRDMKAVEEYMARDKANVDWLNQSFDKASAEGATAIVLSIHANMFWTGFNPPWRAESFLGHSGFKNFGEALVKKAGEFKKPVLLIFGDSHTFRIFKPFPKTAANIQALEVFGAREMHAVEVSVDTNAAGIFGFTPILNPALQ